MLGCSEGEEGEEKKGKGGEGEGDHGKRKGLGFRLPFRIRQESLLRTLEKKGEESYVPSLRNSLFCDSGIHTR